MQHTEMCGVYRNEGCNCPASIYITEHQQQVDAAVRLADDMQKRYHNVFGSAEGKLVLGDIVSLGHVFDTILPDDVAKVAERNFALVILQMAGGLDTLYPQLGLGQRKD